MTRRQTIPSNPNAGPRTYRRRPYDNLRAIIARAEAGEPVPSKRERKAQMEAKTVTAVPVDTRNAVELAALLTANDAPEAIEIRATYREIRTVGQNVTRHLARIGLDGLRASVARLEGEPVDERWRYAITLARRK